MAEEPEQLGLANKDQAAQDKALDQLTDHVGIGTRTDSAGPDYQRPELMHVNAHAGRRKRVGRKQSVYSHGWSYSFPES